MAIQNIQIKAKVTPHNTRQVAAAMAALGDLIGQFKGMNTQEQIDEHVARINGYAYALVNMDVIEEKNSEYRSSVRGLHGSGSAPGRP